MGESRIEVAAFNELPAEAATEALRPAFGNEAWQRVLVVSRPFGSPTELAATSDGVISAMGWTEVAAILPAHALALDPPAGVAPDELSAYEERFGFPFVLEMTGMTAEQIAENLRSRLAADEAAEQQSARRELAAIVRRCLLTTFA